jgi:predicted phosphatase
VVAKLKIFFGRIAQIMSHSATSQFKNRKKSDQLAEQCIFFLITQHFWPNKKHKNKALAELYNSMYFSTHTIRPWPNKKLRKAATILCFLFGQAESYFFGRIVRLPDSLVKLTGVINVTSLSYVSGM